MMKTNLVSKPWWWVPCLVCSLLALFGEQCRYVDFWPRRLCRPFGIVDKRVYVLSTRFILCTFSLLQRCGMASAGKCPHLSPGRRCTGDCATVLDVYENRGMLYVSLACSFRRAGELCCRLMSRIHRLGSPSSAPLHMHDLDVSSYTSIFQIMPCYAGPKSMTSALRDAE